MLLGSVILFSVASIKAESLFRGNHISTLLFELSLFALDKILKTFHPAINGLYCSAFRFLPRNKWLPSAKAEFDKQTKFTKNSKKH